MVSDQARSTGAESAAREQGGSHWERERERERGIAPMLAVLSPMRALLVCLRLGIGHGSVSA